MVLNKKPLEKNRDILSRKGRKTIVPSIAEAWVQSEDFSLLQPSPTPFPASPERAATSERRWVKRPERQGGAANHLQPPDPSPPFGCQLKGEGGGDSGERGSGSISMESMVREV